VTVEYDGAKPVRVDTIVISTQHSPAVNQDTMREDIIDRIVNRVVPAGEEIEAALEMARLYATRAPLSLWFAKTAVNVGLTMPLDAALAFEMGLTTQLFTTADRAEGLRAFHEKRDAKFEGR
jgi:1,4-dihydroxy-2-naphthoyl-CoA synthase